MVGSTGGRQFSPSLGGQQPRPVTYDQPQGQQPPDVSHKFILAQPLGPGGLGGEGGDGGDGGGGGGLGGDGGDGGLGGEGGGGGLGGLGGGRDTHLLSLNAVKHKL